MIVVSDDPVLRQLSRMTPAVPDAAHTASVRARCHATLARQRRRQDASGELRANRGGPLELAVIGGFALAYVSLVVYHALAIHGAL